LRAAGNVAADTLFSPAGRRVRVRGSEAYGSLLSLGGRGGDFGILRGERGDRPSLF